MRVAFTNLDVFDSVDGKSRRNSNVVVKDGKIEAVGADTEQLSGCQVISLPGHTILPGIVDAHVHFAHTYTGYLPFRPYDRWGLIAARTVQAMERMLSTGVTSGRDLGGLDAGYVDAEEKGYIKAPRLAGNAVQFLMPTNGSTDILLPWGGTTSMLGQSIIPAGLPDPHCDGPWECRKRAREVLLAGADVIKIGAGGCLARRKYDHLAPTFTREELDVFVDEGRRQGVKVHCHVFGGPGLRDAIEAGVDSIEHGTTLDDELLALMAEKGTWWVPTFWIIDVHSRLDPTEEDRDVMKRFFENSTRNLERARAAGVRIAMGSDGGMHDEDNSASFLELQFMADAGMSRSDVLMAATRGSAELVGTNKIVGSLEPGKEADAIIVQGDPLKNLSCLADSSKKKLVLKAGIPVGGTWTQGLFDAVLTGHVPAQALTRT